MEQSCLTPCSGQVSEWQANVTPKVQEWQDNLVPMIHELQAKVFPSKLTYGAREAASAPEMTTDEEDRNDSTLDEKPSLAEDSHNEVRVM